MVMFQPLNAKVIAPNYDFSLDTLNDFFPERAKEEIEKKYGPSELVVEKNGMETRKYYVAQIRYKFPVIVQFKDGRVLDFFAKLPSYFLHDIFFQSLTTRHGKQTQYHKFEEEAIYRWEQDKVKHIYSAACTITCFPIFYSVHVKEKIPGFTPQIEAMKAAVPK
jgi:hypothetical protein